MNVQYSGLADAPRMALVMPYSAGAQQQHAVAPVVAAVPNNDREEATSALDSHPATSTATLSATSVSRKLNRIAVPTETIPENGIEGK